MASVSEHMIHWRSRSPATISALQLLPMVILTLLRKVVHLTQLQKVDIMKIHLKILVQHVFGNRIHHYTAHAVTSYTHFDCIFVIIKKQLCVISWQNSFSCTEQVHLVLSDYCSYFRSTRNLPIHSGSLIISHKGVYCSCSQKYISWPSQSSSNAYLQVQ